MRGDITVIIPNRNHGRFLPAAVEAVCTQGRPPARVLVIDDGSTDDSQDVAARLAKRWPVVEARTNARNQGAMATCNEQLAQVKTAYVFFAAADDVMLPGLLEKAAAALDAHPTAAFCTARSRVINPDGSQAPQGDDPRLFPAPGFVSPEASLAVLMRAGAFAAGTTTLHRTALLQARGGFPEDFSAFADGYIYQVQALAHGCCFLDEELAVWQRFDDGIAGRMARDPAQMRVVLDRVLTRMRGADRAFFPEAYVRRFAARWNYATTLAALATGNETNSGLGRGEWWALSRASGPMRARYLLIRQVPADALAVLRHKGRLWRRGALAMLRRKRR